MDPLDVYVLGAGASYVHGAPLTNQILPYALNKSGSKDDESRDALEAQRGYGLLQMAVSGIKRTGEGSSGGHCQLNWWAVKHLPFCGCVPRP
jgi:hypothetical protein